MKKKPGVYLFVHENPASDDIKIIGLFSTLERAREAKRRLIKKPGFRDTPRGFSISWHELDKIGSWHEGYVEVRE